MDYYLLVIDLQLLGMDKAEMIRVFRIIKYTPILALTEPLDAEEKLQLFHAGVSAFLEKPINADVCSAQAAALVKLYLKSDDESSRYAPIPVGSSMVIAPRYRQVLIDGKPLDLTRKEFNLLYFFATHPGQVFSRSQLYEQVWGEYSSICDNTIMVHIRHLREKIEDTPSDPQQLITVKGLGYKLKKRIY